MKKETLKLCALLLRTSVDQFARVPRTQFAPFFLYLRRRQRQLGKRPYLENGAVHFDGEEDKEDAMQAEQRHQEKGGFDQPPVGRGKTLLRTHCPASNVTQQH